MLILPRAAVAFWNDNWDDRIPKPMPLFVVWRVACSLHNHNWRSMSRSLQLASTRLRKTCKHWFQLISSWPTFTPRYTAVAKNMAQQKPWRMKINITRLVKTQMKRTAKQVPPLLLLRRHFCLRQQNLLHLERPFFADGAGGVQILSITTAVQPFALVKHDKPLESATNRYLIALLDV